MLLREQCEIQEEQDSRRDEASSFLFYLFSSWSGHCWQIQTLFTTVGGGAPLTELSGLFRRNDELLSGKYADLVVIRELDGQLKGYKKKYRLVKMEFPHSFSCLYLRIMWYTNVPDIPAGCEVSN